MLPHLTIYRITKLCNKFILTMESELVERVANTVLSTSNISTDKVKSDNNDKTSNNKTGLSKDSDSSRTGQLLQSTGVSLSSSWEDAECLKICPEIIPRSVWRSRMPRDGARKHQMKAAVPLLIKSTASDSCTNREECLKRVKWMQTYHMEIYEFPDIAHSFLIGEDGSVYEGRGWGYENQHGPGFVGIGYMGYYTWDSDTQPTRAMKKAAYRLILCGIMKGFIKNPFKKGIKTLKNGLPDPETWDKYLLQADDEF